MFRRKSATQTKNLLEYLASAEQERQQKSKSLIAQTAAVHEKNADLATKTHNLENLLHGALDRDSFIDLDSLKKTPHVSAFERNNPERLGYLPQPPSGLASLMPWKKKAYERQYEAGEAKYREDHHEYMEALHAHQRTVERDQAEVDAHNQEIERYKQDFAAGNPTAIAEYFELVLEKSPYPAGFLKETEVAFAPDTETLRIDFALPTIDIIPRTKAYAYDRFRDEITETKIPRKQRARLYALVLARISLRTLHEIFTADRSNVIDSIVFEGYVDGMNPSTGQAGRFCLVALKITRQQFDSLDLRQVEPRACLQSLNARLSGKPDQLLAVPPMTVDDRGDASVADGTDNLYLTQQISERDGAITAQSAQIAELESRLEAQRDRIAELVPELRDEQERNAELQVEIQGQKDYIAELESRLEAQNSDNAEHEAEQTDPLDDTQPAEALTEFSAGDEFSEAGMFAPIVGETAEDGAGGVQIPQRADEAEKPVALRDLLLGTAGLPANSDGEATAAPEELPYIREFVTIIDKLRKDESKLLVILMSNSWACSEAYIQSAFPNQFVSSIIHDINERAYDEIDAALIEEEDDMYVIDEEYRHALEDALKLTNNQYMMSGRGRQ